MEPKKVKEKRSVRAFKHVSILPEATKEGAALKVMGKFAISSRGAVASSLPLMEMCPLAASV